MTNTNLNDLSSNSSHKPIKFGVLGLGRAFTLMLNTFTGDSRVQLVAAFDPRKPACDAFAAQLGATYPSARAVCEDANVEWVYVATPHQFHAEHVALAARNGKHVLVEKPMALSLAECTSMMEVCDKAKVQLIIGPSHSFDAPVLVAKQIIDGGTLGKVRMINALNYTDFLYRPRRPEELDTTQGGGVVFSQGAHQIDVIRLLAGGKCTSVRASTGSWDTNRPTEGAYSALLQFGDVFASATYNGYGFFDSDALMNWVGEMGQAKATNTHANTHAKHAATIDEIAEASAKAERNFGGKQYDPITANPPAVGHQHFGFLIISCERGDIRLTAEGVEIFDKQGYRTILAPKSTTPRQTVVDEIWNAARRSMPPLHNGAWSRATLEVCLGILASAKAGQDIIMHQQVTCYEKT
jgi:phthalate 4,5-cis-dihydrodiol dehydrogenase